MDSETTQDVSPFPTPHPWKKAISPSSDRLQSKILACIALPGLAYLSFDELHFLGAGNFAEPNRFRAEITMAIVVSIVFALLAWRLRAATALAAVCGGLICLLLCLPLLVPKGTSVFHSGLTPLIVLFLLTRQATHFKRDRKAETGLAESRHGRNAAQIIANLGVAGVLSSRWGAHIVGWAWGGGNCSCDGASFATLFMLPMLAALAEATADTVSSEIGQAIGGRPYLITTLRRVDPGTDGAISVGGTVAGIASALAIALVGIPALGIPLRQSVVVFACAVFGLFFDSLLGATIERKGWLGNDFVNLLSTGAAAGASILAIRLWPMHLIF